MARSKSVWAGTWTHTMDEKRDHLLFDPETIALMKKAFEDACSRIPPRRAIARSILAERILRAAANGERDPARLRTRALDPRRYGRLGGEPPRLKDGRSSCLQPSRSAGAKALDRKWGASFRRFFDEGPTGPFERKPIHPTDRAADDLELALEFRDPVEPGADSRERPESTACRCSLRASATRSASARRALSSACRRLSSRARLISSLV